MSPLLVRTLTWISRIGLGATFLLSGFTKGVDPYGTLYKIRDYLGALSMDFPDPLILVLSFSLFLTEFLLGLFILLGCYRKVAPRIVALVMIFMLGLTLWIAIADPVADCGCFGDALILSNWTTFWKNVLLTAMALWLVRFNTEVLPLIAPYVQWLAFVGGGLYLAIVSFLGYRIQPVMDFRPFPTGSRLDLNESGEDEEQYVFIYRRGEEEKRVTAEEELPEEDRGWRFDRREEIKREPSTKGLETAFRIFDQEGEEDVTTDLLDPRSATLLICMPEPEKVSKGDIWRIEEAIAEAEQEGLTSLIVAGGGNRTILDMWRENLSDRYPIYQADDTSIKMLVRGNPGVVVLHGDSIGTKTTLSSLPLRSLMEEQGLDTASYSISEFSLPLHGWLKSATAVLCVWLVILIAGSGLGWFIRGGRVRRGESSFHDRPVQRKTDGPSHD